jgi:diaminopimelate decarboxylase
MNRDAARMSDAHSPETPPTDKRPAVERLPHAELQRFVAPFFERREVFLAACAAHGSPLYVIDAQVLRARARRCASVFSAALPGSIVYFAVKSNAHPEVARLLVAEGLGLDVSSGQELTLALDGGATRVLFSGPGKTDAELALAAAHADRVTLLCDSFGELRRIERIVAARDAGGGQVARVARGDHAGDGCGARDERSVRIGVRLTSDEQGLWRKFGIPLAELPAFCAAAGECPHIALRGLQFHTSWNLDPARQVAFIARLGRALATLPGAQRSRIEFLDIGGGFWPEEGEWLHRPPGANEPAGPFAFDPAHGVPPHYRCPAASLETFAAEIAAAVRAHIAPWIAGRVYAEPGRWLAHPAMHILLTVIDKKGPHLVITDGGVNAIGWERYESDYFPVLNLTRPAPVEQACHILGSLCTPHDVWGFAYFGDGIEPGDVLLIPAQGAYTYSLRQAFIKPVPASVVI